MQGSDVERLDGFLLDLIMIHHGAVADHDFGDGIMEVRAGALVGLDNGALGVGIHQDQNARVGHSAVRAFVGDFDGLFDHRVARDLQHRHTVEKRGVQGDEGVSVDGGVAGKILLHFAGLELLHILGNRHEGPIRGWREGGPCDRRDVGEAPLFVVGVGETEFGEAREGPLAEGLEPCLGRRRLAREAIQPDAGLFRYSAHTLPTASVSS